MGSASVQGELWGALAEDWATLAEPTTQPLHTAILRATEVSAGTILLDMGCGAGKLCALSADLGAQVHGLDASAALIEIAQREVPSGEFRQGDIEDLPYADATFDVVTACNCIQFADDRGRAVEQAKRVTKPGGTFAIGMWAEPDRNEMSAIFKAVREIAPPLPPSDEPPPTDITQADNLKALVESAGFKVSHVAEVECVFDFASAEEASRGMRSAGLIVQLARLVGDDNLRHAIDNALIQFRGTDGRVRMSNWFRYAVGNA